MEVTTISNIFDPKMATYIRTYQHYLSVAPTLIEGDKNRRRGLTGLTGLCPWAERKSSPSFVWNP